ncbi:hypothetical protein, partial [Falsigemmobacter intermedius]|uniref:hypothetical protein n=1 Tax=Falsigemmobacter intermedius TaxID=1553448 RepID=UPI0035EBEBF2
RLELCRIALAFRHFGPVPPQALKLSSWSEFVRPPLDEQGGYTRAILLDIGRSQQMHIPLGPIRHANTDHRLHQAQDGFRDPIVGGVVTAQLRERNAELLTIRSHVRTEGIGEKLVVNATGRESDLVAAPHFDELGWLNHLTAALKR